MILQTKNIKIYDNGFDLLELKYTVFFKNIDLIYDMAINNGYLVITCSSDVSEEKIFDLAESYFDLTKEDKDALIFSNKVEEMKKWIQEYLDETSLSFGYDDIKSVRSYTGFSNPFQAECTDIARWCTECWTYTIQAFSDIQAGIRTFPSTKTDLVNELPILPITPTQ